jgi:hypothetical protein
LNQAGKSDINSSCLQCLMLHSRRELHQGHLDPVEAMPEFSDQAGKERACAAYKEADG